MLAAVDILAAARTMAVAVHTVKVDRLAAGVRMRLKSRLDAMAAAVYRAMVGVVRKPSTLAVADRRTVAHSLAAAAMIAGRLAAVRRSGAESTNAARTLAAAARRLAAARPPLPVVLVAAAAERRPAGLSARPSGLVCCGPQLSVELFLICRVVGVGQGSGIM